MRGYLVASVQHDVEADGEMVTQAGAFTVQINGQPVLSKDTVEKFQPGKEIETSLTLAGVGVELLPGETPPKPVLRPGEDFEYTSGVPLPTPSGFMTGTYGMVTEAGEPFDIDIPAFSLDAPQGERTIN